MAHRQRVAFVGWSPAQLDAKASVLPPPFREECGTNVFTDGLPDDYLGAVVGDRALADLDPEELVRLLESSDTPFCLYALEAPGSIRSRWLDHGLNEKFANGDLRDRVRDWARSMRPTFPPSAWMPRKDFDDEFRMLLELVQELPKGMTGLWAEAAGMSRHALRRYCLEQVHLSPEEVIWRWFEHSVRLLRRKYGATLEDVAAMYGYSNGGSVHRAFQRRGRPIPPRNPEPRPGPFV